jgi:hypothetical protein
MALEAQFFHHDPLVIPKWVRLDTYPAGSKEVTWTFSGQLQEIEKGMSTVRLVFRGSAKKFAVCTFDVLV